MNLTARTISNALNLRAPQRESLDILAQIMDIVPLSKERDVADILKGISAAYPSVADFERSFPSLCFALATGVGKTRLMGAFISYLYTEKGIRNFFVLAPNLTIYKKLVDDFTANTPKYVFKGIPEFAASPPLIVTGDNYESFQGDDMISPVNINVFNVSKISEKTSSESGRKLRIKSLVETLGESYFKYLSELPDLVLLMDEAHRYRADAAMDTLAELNPLLGLELTATPQIEKGKNPVPFKNVIYNYPLHKAMTDGFVKEPAVATRKNFDPNQYTEEQLDLLKLKDGMIIHENIKTELQIYAAENQKSPVKPFVLVVAADTKHAGEILAYIKSDEFFEGIYRDKVITVHSNQKGAEKDETIERLIAVENPAEPTEIVIHVNMLKEGWDVTNLYTIIPLRTANSRTLVEQSIGRGLRLPYGRRTGVPLVDGLAIVAHDRFEEIVREAKSGNSIFKNTYVIGGNVPEKPHKVMAVKSVIDSDIENAPKEERPIALAVVQAVRELEKDPTSKRLQDADIRRQIFEKVKAQTAYPQFSLGVVETPDQEKIVEKTIENMIAKTIGIPRVSMVPKTFGTPEFLDFDLDTSKLPRLQPIDNRIMMETLRTGEQAVIEGENAIYEEERPENYIVSALLSFEVLGMITYGKIINKMVEQTVAHLKSYLDETALNKVLQLDAKTLANEIFRQMQSHSIKKNVEYQVSVSQGYTHPAPYNFTYAPDETPRPFKDEVSNPKDIRGMLFTGFEKCLYPIQKFDSDTERLFSVILENDDDVTKWIKPARGDFKIILPDNSTHTPDFIIETATAKYIAETKAAKDIDSSEVQEKAMATAKWCHHASTHELQNNGKPWHYSLIPDTAVKMSASFLALAKKFERK